MMSRLLGVMAGLAIGALAPATALATPDTTPPAPPDVVSTLPAGNIDNTGAVDFSFSSEPGATFLCAVDGSPPAPCDSPLSLGDLIEGDHDLSVVALDAADNAGDPATVDWTEDYTAPAAPSIAGDQPAVTSDPDATLTFSGEAGGSFECSFDGDTFTECASPLSYAGLADAGHELLVRQVDDAGNVGPAGAHDWRVDTTPPHAPALDANVEALTGLTSATFTFAGEPGGSFRCALDAGPPAACTSPRTYTVLAAGYHELLVEQDDAAGNAGDQAIFDWSIDPSLAPSAPAIVAPVLAGPVNVPTPPRVIPPVAPVIQPNAPKARPCVSRRTVTVHWRLPARTRAGAPKVLLDGHVVMRLKPSARSALINLAGHPKALVRVVVEARSSHGVLLRTQRTYATCLATGAHAPLQTMVLHVAR
jgi:hypothetical protein